MRVVVLAMLAVGCPSAGHRSAQDVSSFTDGAWVLSVEREAEGGANQTTQFPRDEIPEDAYHPVPAGRSHRVIVSERGDRVAIPSLALTGTRVHTSPDRVAFSLEQGTGGRFVVRRDDAGLEGELTLYGSGVPIVRSKRGRLARESS